MLKKQGFICLYLSCEAANLIQETMSVTIPAHRQFKPTVETYQTAVREPEHDKSHSRINIQTLGIGFGALCKQSQLSSCDQDSFLAVNILEPARKLRMGRVDSSGYTLYNHYCL